ncbi:N-acetylmuramidase domain-containing protein [Aureimonas pseudogalii]|uniref:N-acetylmuramidase domain-containing protein n=1 Tax=Aureimonas pseudogalii TaxID=1744844 RepID=A0A7W6H5P1_9HYPH|nr:N-acetylmuramidase domain-containing protein [Aureimonas pseudogalii]MBB3999037.1 hypothetical protein [Aureimonas pseudogalii]
MAITREVADAARAVEAREGVAAAVLLAVALVETNARATARVGERDEPLIRFEGHYFDRLLAEPARRIARTAGLSHPKAGRIRNPAGQEARWRLLARAEAIDPEAAFAATSWGLGQVMGAHWQRLGFRSAADLAVMARGSAEGQLTIAARFLKLGHLADRLVSGDAAGFARLYNGPRYAENAYHTKIAAAYRAARRALGEGASAPA